MNNSSRTEPTAIVVSMALTALASNYIESATSIWGKIVALLIFVFAGASATQLYWSLIIPLLRNQLDVSFIRRENTKYELLGLLIPFYFQISIRFFTVKCTIEEIRLLGYLNGMLAFLIFFLSKFPYKLDTHLNWDF